MALCANQGRSPDLSPRSKARFCLSVNPRSFSPCRKALTMLKSWIGKLDDDRRPIRRVRSHPPRATTLRTDKKSDQLAPRMRWPRTRPRSSTSSDEVSTCASRRNTHARERRHAREIVREQYSVVYLTHPAGVPVHDHVSWFARYQS